MVDDFLSISEVYNNFDDRFWFVSGFLKKFNIKRYLEIKFK